MPDRKTLLARTAHANHTTPPDSLIQQHALLVTTGAETCSTEARSAVAVVAAKQFERLMAHSRLPALLLAPGADAAAGLPAAAKAAVPPLQSLLPLAAAPQQPQVRPRVDHPWINFLCCKSCGDMAAL